MAGSFMDLMVYKKLKSEDHRALYAGQLEKVIV